MIYRISNPLVEVFCKILTHWFENIFKVITGWIISMELNRLKRCLMHMIKKDLKPTKIYLVTCFGKSYTKRHQREQKLFSLWELLMKAGLIRKCQIRTYISLLISGLWNPNKEWFDSFYRFEQQQSARWSYGNFNILGLGLPNRGYMGNKFQDMG